MFGKRNKVKNSGTKCCGTRGSNIESGSEMNHLASKSNKRSMASKNSSRN